MESIKTKILNNNKFTLYALLFLFIGASITIFLSFEIHNLSTPFIGLLISIFVPQFFKKKFINAVTINFSTGKINIILFDELSNDVLNNYDFEYNKIKSFSARDSSKSDISFFNLIMKNNKSFSFRIMNAEKTDITNLIIKYILEYNESILNKEDKIKMTPGFFATKSGKIAVYILTVLLLITLTMEIIYLRKNQSYLMIPGIVIYLGILLQRKNDLDTEKKWNEKHG